MNLTSLGCRNRRVCGIKCLPVRLKQICNIHMSCQGQKLNGTIGLLLAICRGVVDDDIIYCILTKSLRLWYQHHLLLVLASSQEKPYIRHGKGDESNSE